MIYVLSGGSGAGGGATLVVSSPANVSVTVSKDDKSYTKNSGDLGSATFKRLSTGTWTVTIESNGQVATKTALITADYSVTIAFFTATITITYPANSDCVVTDSGGTTVSSDSNSTGGTKTFTATVNASGIYTITATATDGSGKTKSGTVSITAAGQSKSITLSYELVLYNVGTGVDLWEGSTSSTYPENAIASTDNSQLYLYAKENYGASSAYFTTKSTYDLSQYSNLEVTLTQYSNNGSTSQIAVGTAKKGTDLGALNVTGTGVFTLPIDTVNSMGYVTLYVKSGEGGGQIVSMTITKVRLC